MPLTPLSSTFNGGVKQCQKDLEKTVRLLFHKLWCSKMLFITDTQNPHEGLIEFITKVGDRELKRTFMLLFMKAKTVALMKGLKCIIKMKIHLITQLTEVTMSCFLLGSIEFTMLHVELGELGDLC